MDFVLCFQNRFSLFIFRCLNSLIYDSGSFLRSRAYGRLRHLFTVYLAEYKSDDSENNCSCDCGYYSYRYRIQKVLHLLLVFSFPIIMLENKKIYWFLTV